MSDSDAESVIASIEANYRQYVSLFPVTIPGSEVKESNGLFMFYTGDPAPPANGVVSTRINPAELDETIRQVQDYFRAKRVPMSWTVFPSDEPADLGEALERHGFVMAEEQPWLAVPLEEVSAEMSVIPGLEIMEAKDRETLFPGTKLIIKVFEWPEIMIEKLVERSLTVIEKLPGQQLYYTAYLDGRVVGTSWVFLTLNGVAGIFNVATLEDVRRRGIGRALTLHALIEARKLGYTLGILAATEMGYRMYESLGFKEYCKIRFYFWQPEEVLPAPDSLTEK